MKLVTEADMTRHADMQNSRHVEANMRWFFEAVPMFYQEITEHMANTDDDIVAAMRVVFILCDLMCVAGIEPQPVRDDLWQQRWDANEKYLIALSLQKMDTKAMQAFYQAYHQPVLLAGLIAQCREARNNVHSAWLYLVMKTLFDAMELADSLGVHRPGIVFVPGDLESAARAPRTAAG